MHIHAQPVAGAVHVEGQVGALLQHVLHVADPAAVQNAQIEQALGQHGQGRLVRIVEAAAGRGGIRCGLLRRQHHIVDSALFGSKAAIGRKGARDVAGVTVQFAAGIDQHQLAGAQRGGIGTVMQHTGIGTGSDDAGIGRKLRTLTAEFVQQLGFQVVFTRIGSRAQQARAFLHGAHMGPGADLRGAAHQGQLVCVLDQAHLVQQRAGIQLARRRDGTQAGARTYRIEPAGDTTFQAGVGGKRVGHQVGTVEQGRHFLVDHGLAERGIDAQAADGGIRAEAVAIPDFALQVFWLTEQRGVGLAGSIGA